MLNTPQFVAIGHLTRDVHENGFSTLGGTVSFAAATALSLGYSAGIVSYTDPDLTPQLPHLLPNVLLALEECEEATTFANSYEEGFRSQYLYARSPDISLGMIPSAWQRAPVTLLGPLAQEIPIELVNELSFRSHGLLAATPQGWLRSWDDQGKVSAIELSDELEEALFRYLQVIIVSVDDLMPYQERSIPLYNLLQDWSRRGPLVVATEGRAGSTLFHNGRGSSFPAYNVPEVDPTGAGDVFATAFLLRFYEGASPESAVDFANCVASFVIEATGLDGLPASRELVRERQLQAAYRR
jgi:hypothetical protein